MITPLRSAVEYLVTLSCGWSIAELARLAETTPRGAQVFATALLNQQVLVQSGELYARGPNAANWKKHRPKTNRGGGAKRYLLCKKTRDELQVRDWKTLRGQLPPLTLQNAVTPTTMSQESRAMTMAAITDPDAFLTVGDVARKLKVSTFTVRRWIKIGELRAAKIGGVIRIPKHVIDDMREV